MYHFFVEPSQIMGNKIVIRGSDVNHIRNVLRMKPGEEIAVSNGIDGKEYRCGIESLEGEEITCSLRFVKEDGAELPVRVTLFQGLPKADKMELIVQKAVELGVSEIVPVAAARCVVRLDEKKAAAKRSRWQGIAEAAAKQSRRGQIPQVHEVMRMSDALAYGSTMDVCMIPYELAENMEHTRKLLERIQQGQSVAVFIGPEGGFEPGEVQRAAELGIEPITLGRRILRTETAGMMVLSWLGYLLE